MEISEILEQLNEMEDLELVLTPEGKEIMVPFDSFINNKPYYDNNLSLKMYQDRAEKLYQQQKEKDKETRNKVSLLNKELKNLGNKSKSATGTNYDYFDKEISRVKQQRDSLLKDLNRGK